MADIADVMDALQRRAVAAVYPSGGDCLHPQGYCVTGAAKSSISGTVVNIGQGWPPPGAVDQAMAAGNSLVSIYAVPSSTSKLPVPLETGQNDVVAPPVHGMTAEPTETGFVLCGFPGPGEYATAIVNGRAYSCAAVAGDTAQSIAAGLAFAINENLPGTAWLPTWIGAAISIPLATSIIVRIGAPATVGRVIDRQRQNIMLGVWSPTPSDRTVLGRALKVMVGQNLTVTMPDTSLSIWIAQTENLIDKYENELAFRRDLTVQCQFDTVETYPAYEVTAVNVTTDPQSGDAPISKFY